MGKVTNDQEDIIEALSEGRIMYVWQRVKYIGYKTCDDMNERYTIFCDCVADFDFMRNNNFIKFYKDRLRFNASYMNATFYVSDNRAVVQNLRNENISPTDNNKSKITRELKNWSN